MKEKALKRFLGTQLRRNIIAGPMSSGVNIALTLLSYPVYLKYLGYDLLGVWLILATVVAFIQLTNLGIGPALSTFVAEARGRQDTEAIIGYISTAFFSLLVLGTTATVLVWIAGDRLLAFANLHGEYQLIAKRLLPWAGLISLVAFMGQSLTAGISGLGRVDLSLYIDMVSRIAVLAFTILFLILGWKVESLIVATLLAQCGLLFSCFIVAKKCIGVSPVRIKGFEVKWLKSLWGRSRGLLAGSAATLMLQPFNRMAVARWTGVSAIPVIEMAYSGAMQMRAFLETSGRALAPEVSSVWAKAGASGCGKIRHLQSRLGRIMLFLALPIWILAGISAEWALRVWLGARFQPTIVPVFRLMLAGSFFSLMAVPSYYVLLGLGETSALGKGQLILALTNVALILSSVFLFGTVSLEMVALAFVFSAALSMVYYVWRAHAVLRRMSC